MFQIFQIDFGKVLGGYNRKCWHYLETDDIHNSNQISESLLHHQISQYIGIYVRNRKHNILNFHEVPT